VISAGVTRPSSLLRAHAPDLRPLHAFALRSSAQSLQVAVSPCWSEAFPDAISADLCSHAWTPTPVLLLVHVLVSSQETSAFPALEPGRLRTKSVQRLPNGQQFRGCSHSLMFRPAELLATQVAPTAVLSPGSRGFYVRASSQVVAFLRFGYACRPNRAIDGRGLAPHETHSLVGCSSNVGCS
jgi:hypothetical protein